METIRKEIKREVTDVVVTYVACDGTEFKNEDECKKYEDTAECVIKAKFMKLVVKECDAWDLMGGVEDNLVYFVKMQKDIDKDTVSQMVCLHYQYWYKSDKSMMEARMKDANKKIEDAFADDGIIFIGENCDGDLYMIDARCNIIKRMMDLGK